MKRNEDKVNEVKRTGCRHMALDFYFLFLPVIFSPAFPIFLGQGKLSGKTALSRREQERLQIVERSGTVCGRCAARRCESERGAGRISPTKEGGGQNML